MLNLAGLDFLAIKKHYLYRKNLHKLLKRHLVAGNAAAYAELALGIAEPHGNYSAAEHGLGPMVLSNNPKERVLKLGQDLFACRSVRLVPDMIYSARISYLKISVGSEMAMMLRPDRFWTGNVRTIWPHLVIKHNSTKLADVALSLYKTQDSTSEMNYQIWRDIYPSLQSSLLEVQNVADAEAKQLGVTPGKLRYLWTDVVCSFYYDHKHDR